MMNKNLSLKEKRQHRVRMKLKRKANRLRLTVFRSNRFLYAQIIDDSKGETLVSATVKELDEKEGSKKTERAFALGKTIAEKAQKEKIKEVVFDRGRFAYHGRIKALADGAREGGLQF